MTLLARLRRFVDWDLGRSGGVRAGAWILLISGLPFVSLLVFERLAGHRSGTAIILASAVTAAWLGFVGWRGWRLLRASGARSDRDFDQRGKFRLPPEHQDSESVTKAQRRDKRS